MAVPYAHKLYFLELSNEEIIELKDIHIFVKDFFKGNNYFSFTRESMANRSVEHLHMHFLAGKLQ
jgi:diadenosine tetraphosphate (Ap4A) HIT family hydrolase